ncbi:hypothetical protein PanWU01x14_130540 [Parasponia andersonii]|uniref:Uncharacterized protein n=1 Tax=Parasponia andersonii TaxID=3476 RepID=A0A2P5CR98_PARAD|nr:hypothetical protein PanWU01x14_130540 [Parasponia andersonii]
MDVKRKPKIPAIEFSLEDLKPGTKSWGSRHANNSFMDQPFDLPKEIKERNTSEKPFRGYYSSNVVYESMGFGNSNNQDEARKFANIFGPSGNNYFR